MHRRKTRTALQDNFMLVLTGFLSCTGAICLSVLLFSVIAANVSLPESIINIMSGVALCTGCISAGYSVAKKRRRSGLLTGIICGIVIFFAVLLTGIVFVKLFTAMGVISKFVIILTCAAIGGVIGVNSPQRIR